MQFSDYRILVTAGADGIGRSIVGSFLEAGARVHVADISEDACQQLRLDAGDASLAVTCADVSNAESVETLFSRHAELLGGLDVLVNCAGIKGPTGPVESIGYKDWQQCIGVNLDATFLCSRSAVPMLREANRNASRHPSIVSLSSTAGWHGYANRSAYAAAKWAVIGFTKSIAMELGPEGIRANAICPGSVNGERMDRVIADESRESGIDQQALREKYTRGSSMRSFIEPEDIADMALFLASPAARRVTGQAISVDGQLENFGDA